MHEPNLQGVIQTTLYPPPLGPLGCLAWIGYWDGCGKGRDGLLTQVPR